MRHSKRLDNGTPSSTPSFALRATTPDARQLHENLRAASVSPVKEKRGRSEVGSPHSSITPSPPVQRTISSTSTPAPPSLNPAITAEKEVLEPQTDRGFSFFRYPRLPYFGSGRKASSIVLSSPLNEDNDSNDDASVVSWRLERELHQNDLKRTKSEPEPEPYNSGLSEGRNIRKPPRRLSGLTWTNDTTNSVDNRTGTAGEYKDEVTDENDENDDDHDQREESLDADRKSETPMLGAAARTVISTAIGDQIEDSVISRSRSPSTDRHAPVDRARQPVRSNMGQEVRDKASKWHVLLLAITILSTTFGITAYFLGVQLKSNPLLSWRSTDYPTLNATEDSIVSFLSEQVVKLDDQVKSVSRDVIRLNYEQNKALHQTPILAPMPEAESRINFFSRGVGTRVDRKLTSPSIGVRRTLSRRLKESLTGRTLPQPNPPETALEAWGDIGDCWCAAPSKTGQAQLALDLGRRAVLDEVVVEHIPASASLDPSLAPRTMELWAQFKPFSGAVPQQQQQFAKATETAVVSQGGWFGYWRPSTHKSSPSSSSSASSTSSFPSSLSSMMDAILETLHQAYPSESSTAYADDPLLGPTFFRLGKWEYDQEGDSVQHFALNALIDYPNLRIDKVVLRAISNWGGNHTCLYRVKAHGHV